MKKLFVFVLLLSNLSTIPCYSQTTVDLSQVASIEEIDQNEADFDDLFLELELDDDLFGLGDRDFDDIDLATIDKFSKEPDFFEKMHFLAQYLKIQCHNSWKAAKTHILENKELYIIGTTTTAVILTTVVIITLLNKRNQHNT